MIGAANDFNSRSVLYPSKGLGVNSNSGNGTLADIAGLGSQFRAFDPRGYNTGIDLRLPVNSFSSAEYQTQVKLAAIQQQIYQIQRQISELQTRSSQSTPQTIRK